MKRNTYVIIAAIVAAGTLIVLPMALAIRDMLVEPSADEQPPARSAPADPGTPPGPGEQPRSPESK